MDESQEQSAAAASPDLKVSVEISRRGGFHETETDHKGTKDRSKREREGKGSD